MNVFIGIIGLIFYAIYGIISEKIEAELLKIEKRLCWWIFFDRIFVYALEDKAWYKK